MTRSELAAMQSERRKNFRCPSASDGETVVLRYKGVDQTAKVVDLSAEGFRIAFEAESGIESAKVGDVALLATRNGSHEVRIANVQIENQTVRLGLERVADFSRAGQRVRKIDMSKGRVGGGRRSGDPSSSMLVKVGLVVAIGVLAMVGINLTLTAHGKSGGHAVAKTAGSPGIGDQAAQRPTVEAPAAAETKTFQEPPAREHALADPKFDAAIKIVSALKRATRENKTVLVEFGTDKCESCYRLRDYLSKNAEFAAAFQRDFVLVLVDKATNQTLFNRLVPAEQQKDASCFAVLDREGRTVKVEKTKDVAGDTGFDINKLKALLQPPSQKE